MTNEQAAKLLAEVIPQLDNPGTGPLFTSNRQWLRVPVANLTWVLSTQQGETTYDLAIPIWVSSGESLSAAAKAYGKRLLEKGASGGLPFPDERVSTKPRLCRQCSLHATEGDLCAGHARRDETYAEERAAEAKPAEWKSQWFEVPMTCIVKWHELKASRPVAPSDQEDAIAYALAVADDACKPKTLDTARCATPGCERDRINRELGAETEYGKWCREHWREGVDFAASDGVLFTGAYLTDLKKIAKVRTEMDEQLRAAPVKWTEGWLAIDATRTYISEQPYYVTIRSSAGATCALVSASAGAASQKLDTWIDSRRTLKLGRVVLDGDGHVTDVELIP